MPLRNYTLTHITDRRSVHRMFRETTNSTTRYDVKELRNVAVVTVFVIRCYKLATTASVTCTWSRMSVKLPESRFKGLFMLPKLLAILFKQVYWTFINIWTHLRTISITWLTRATLKLSAVTLKTLLGPDRRTGNTAQQSPGAGQAFYRPDPKEFTQSDRDLNTKRP